MRIPCTLSFILTLAVGAAVATAGSPEKDLAAARALFDANLAAIEARDRDAYLACYLDAETLARTGPEGPVLGFASHAAQAGERWPDRLEAHDLRLVPVRAGVVYGTYRYRVRYGAEEHAGLSERLFVKTKKGWRIAVTGAFDAPPGTPPPPRAIVGATLIDGTGRPPILDAVVVLRDGRIECAGSRADCPVPEGIGALDARGTWITPGIVDSHVHFSQTGWADGRPDSLDLRDRHPYDSVQAELAGDPQRWFRTYLCSGVTAVFDVGGFPWTLELPARTESDASAPHVAATGPLLSTIDHWLRLPAERQFVHLTGPDAAREGVHYLQSKGAAAIKVWFIVSADRPFEEMAAAVAAAGQEAAQAGLPLIVHATGLREAKAALAAGAKLLVHSVWDLPVDDEFLSLAKKNGTIYCPTLTVADGYVRMFASAAEGQPPEIDDPNGCVDAETRARLASTPELGRGRVNPDDLARRRLRTEERRKTSFANLARVHAAGIPVAMGTDAGNPLTLHGPSVYAEMEAMQAAGLAPMDVVVSSTRIAAQAMGRLADFGTLEKGKLADLLVLGSDPLATVAAFRDLRFVVRGGVVRAAEELHAPGKATADPARASLALLDTLSKITQRHE